MAFKFISLLLVVACLLANTQGASTRKPVKGERVAALYIKDGSNGELRFLGGNSNAQLNQYITQKQNFLEQLRPINNYPSTGSWGTGGTGIITTTGTGAGITGTGTTSGFGSSGVPIVITTGPNGNRRPGGIRRGNKRRNKKGNKNGQIYVIRPKA